MREDNVPSVVRFLSAWEIMTNSHSIDRDRK